MIQVNSRNAEFEFDCRAHGEHFFLGLDVVFLKGASVFHQSLLASQKQSFMDIVVVHCAQVGGFIKAINESIIQAHTTYEPVCATIGIDDMAPQFIALDKPELGCRCIKDWEWLLHDRDDYVKRLPVYDLHELFTVTFFKAARDDNHFIQKVAQDVAHLIEFCGFHGLKGLAPLQVRNPNRYCYGDYRSDCLQPRSQIGVRLDPSQHDFLSKREILS